MSSPKRARDLRRKYGITLQQYEDRLAEQGGTCAICSKPPKSHRALVVDHCHGTSRVRGLLCDKCNTALGLLGDDPITLLCATAYLVGR